MSLCDWKEEEGERKRAEETAGRRSVNNKWNVVNLMKDNIFQFPVISQLLSSFSFFFFEKKKEVCSRLYRLMLYLTQRSFVIIRMIAPSHTFCLLLQYFQFTITFRFWIQFCNEVRHEIYTYTQIAANVLESAQFNWNGISFFSQQFFFLEESRFTIHMYDVV